jgi:hypothetical protein
MQADSSHIESVDDLTDQVCTQVDATDRLLDQAGERISNAATTRLTQAKLQSEQAKNIVRLAQAHVAHTRARAAHAKQRELAAHLRAEALHERAVELQAQLGHHDRAATARAHADHARQLYEDALVEQAEQEAWSDGA